MTVRAALRRSPLRGWQLAVAVPVVLVCAGSGVQGATAAQTADELTGCPIVAGAQALSTTVQKNGDLALAQPTGNQTPAAQVCLDAGLGESTAYAAAAYPGSTVTSAPGATADYPGYVASSYPGTPDAKAENPAFTVHARSAASESQATAQTGPPSVGTSAGTASADASGSVDTATRTARARASSLSTPLGVNGVLALGEVHSTAEARLRSDGKVDRTSSLEVARTTVAGQAVSITSSGVHAAGQDVPLPETGDVTDVLAAAGIFITYLSEQKTPNGIVSAGLKINVVAKDSAGVPTVTSLVLGRSFAAVAVRGLDSGSESDPGSSGSLDGPVISPPTAPGGGTPGGFPIQGSPAEPESPDSGASSGPAPQLAGGNLAPVVKSATGVSLGTFYFVLVAGGLALLVSCTSMRLLGVRTRWIS